METTYAEQKPWYKCEYCNKVFTRKSNRQRHQRRIHGRICREKEVNLHLHLQHLSESEDFLNEWMFVESRPIQPGDYNVCPCGQSGIESYFFLENKYNGNRTFVGADCIRNIDPGVTTMIPYFKDVMENPVQGIYKGQDNQGLQRFEVKPNTVLIKRLKQVEHLNLQIPINLNDGKSEVIVTYPNAETLVEGQTYSLKLKAKYERGHLTVTAM